MPNPLGRFSDCRCHTLFLMAATEIIRQIEALPEAERDKMRHWVRTHDFQESPEMLAALDAAARSADERGTIPVSEVRKMLTSWTSGSV